MSFGKLVSALLDDSEKFLAFARQCSRKKENALMLSYCRAVFFGAWSALEGWINYVGTSFARTDRTLSQYEVSFLTEKRIEIDDRGLISITKQDDYHPALKKLLFIFRRFGRDFDFKHSKPDLWRELKEIEAIRHSVVHPRSREQGTKVSLEEAEKCYETVLTTINLLKEKIFDQQV